jgi:DNA repair exonuclease SbcCD nuclease subunit
MAWFNAASKAYSKIYVIPGNHDHRVDGYATDFLTEMHNDNIVYVTPDSEQFVYELCDDLHGFLMPYFDPEKIELDYYQFVDKYADQIVKGRTILCGHLYDQKAKVGSEIDLVTKYVANIDFSEFKRHFDLVITGHIHKAQEYDSKDVRIVYPGTFQCHTGADLGLQKKFLTLNNRLKLEYIETPHIMFVEKKLTNLEEDLFTDLDPDRRYVIYLEVDFSSMKSDYYMWKKEQFEKYPNLMYINDSFLSKSASGAMERLKEVKDNYKFEDALQDAFKTVSEGLEEDEIPFNKEEAFKELNTFVLKDAV